MTVFAGFDCSGFPGPTMMERLKATNLSWVGYYLVAPSHPNAGWRGQRSMLRAMGWGIAPIFVGQQLAGPGSHNVSGLSGVDDGVTATEHLYEDGFSQRSTVYLDLEDGPPFDEPRTDYVRAWVSAVEGAGFQPGIYCSHLIAEAVVAANPGVRIWAYRVPTVARTTQAKPYPTPGVYGCGYGAATAWQRAQNVLLTDFNLVVDLSVSVTPDPGAP